MEQKTTFDSRTILAIILCFGIWWGWNQFYLQKKYPEISNPTTVSKTNTLENAEVGKAENQKGGIISSAKIGDIRGPNSSAFHIGGPHRTLFSFPILSSG